MAQINLAPGTQYILATKRRRRNLYLLSLLVAIIVIAAWGAVVLLEQRSRASLNAVNANIKSLDTEIARLNADAGRVKSFSGRLTALNGLLSQRHSWGPVLKELERLLPASVSLSALDLNRATQKVKVEGTASDLDAVALTIASLTDQPGHPTLFSGVSVNSVTRKDNKDADGQTTGSHVTFIAVLSLKTSSATDSLNTSGL